MKRGFTLLEVLVGSTLFLLLLALAFGYLIPATKAAYQLRLRSHVQQTATVVLAKIRQAAATTAPGGFSWSDQSPVALAFNPVDKLQPANSVLLWAPSYVLYWWDEPAQTLWSGEWPNQGLPPSPAEISITRAKRLPSQRLGEVVASLPEGARRQMATGVHKFSVQHQGDQEAFVQPLIISIELRESARTDQPVIGRSLTLRLVNQQ